MPGLLRSFLIVISVIVIAPIIGGILSGLDRKITARLQGRYGPPIAQPFYDVIKLLSKESQTVNQTQSVYVLGYLFFAVATLCMFFLGRDLLIMMFVLAFSTVSLILGATSLRSPYSKIGAQREIMQMMAYEPVLLLMVVGIYLSTGSFMISEVVNYHYPLIAKLPLVFVAFVAILTIKLRKSPFDFSTSHHAHQELVKGITTEFSGIQLAIIEITHWYEIVLFLALMALFFAQPIWVGILIALACYFIEILIDNACARMTWKWMLAFIWTVGIGAAVVNIIWLYLS